MKRRFLTPLLVLAALAMACSCLPTTFSLPGRQTPQGGSGGESAGYQEASRLAGHWAGTWKNASFGTTGDVDIDIQVDPHGSATITVDLTGNVLGVGNVPRLTIPARYDNVSLFSDLVELPVFGPTTFVLSWDGTITMSSTTPPGTSILYVSAQGHVSGDQMQITYDIPFKLGGSSSGTATLQRSP